MYTTTAIIAITPIATLHSTIHLQLWWAKERMSRRLIDRVIAYFSELCACTLWRRQITSQLWWGRSVAPTIQVSEYTGNRESANETCVTDYTATTSTTFTGEAIR